MPASLHLLPRYTTPQPNKRKGKMNPGMQHKACDQCYSKKKKCLVHSGSLVCVRCEGLSLACTVSRRRRRTGRPPGRALPGVADRSLGVWDYSLSEGKPGDSPADKHRGEPSTVHDSPVASVEGTDFPLPLELQVNDFYHLSDIYMFGPTFARDFHRALEYCHYHSPYLLAEILRALGSCLSWARVGALTADQVDIRSGAVCIEKLRNAEINNIHDTVAVLILGQSLTAFDSLVTSTGTISILRCSLFLNRPWYPEIARIQLLEPITIAPIFWDTIWCLMHCEIPVLRPLTNRMGLVDRVAGLCTSLLPILYDLCVFNQQRKHGILQRDCRLDEIEQQTRAWSPDDSDLTPKRYNAVEILSIRTQAIMYQAATLLLIHRVRHPLTLLDTTATTLANDILTAREDFFANAGSSAKLQNTSFPVFLALLEVSIAPDGLWESSTWLRIRPACVDHLFAFNSYVWEQRHAGFNGSLFDLIDSGPEFVPVP